MATHYTPVYAIAYADTDTAVGDLAAVTQSAGQTVEAALLRGGVVPPAAADLNAVTSRVVSLEGSRTADENRLTALEALRPGKRVTKTVAQPTVAGTWLRLVWEQFDVRTSGTGMWSSTVNPSRLTAPTSGRYRSVVTVSGANNIQIRSNAPNYPTTGTDGVMQAAATNPGSIGVLACVADEVYLTAGQFVEAFAVTTAAGSVGTVSGYTAFFSLTYIGA